MSDPDFRELEGGGIGAPVLDLLQGGPVSAESFVDGVLEQLRAARSAIEEQLVALSLEGERIDAAITALTGAATEAPASGERPESRDVGLPRPGTQAGAGASVTPPGKPTTSQAGEPKPASLEQVLDWMREHGRGWVSMSAVRDGVDGSRRTVSGRLRALVARGAIESNGLATNAARYRLADVDGGRGGSSEEPSGTDIPAAEDTERALASTAAVNVGALLRPKIEGMLQRASSPLSSRDIACSLVVPIPDVAEQLQVMVRQSEQGDRYPAIVRDEHGLYALAARSAA